MATINSAQSGDFSDPSTWIGGVVPISGDTAVAADGHIITIDQNLVLLAMINAGSGYFLMTGSTPYTITCTNNTRPATSASSSLFIFDSGYSAEGTVFDFPSNIGSQGVQKNAVFEFLSGSSGDFTMLGTITAGTSNLTYIYGVYSEGHTDITLAHVIENSIRGVLYFDPDDFASLVVNTFELTTSITDRNVVAPSTVNSYADITLNSSTRIGQASGTATSLVIYGSLTINAEIYLYRDNILVGDEEDFNFFIVKPGATLVITGDQRYYGRNLVSGSGLATITAIVIDNPELVSLGGIQVGASRINTQVTTEVYAVIGVGDVELTGDEYRSGGATNNVLMNRGIEISGDIYMRGPKSLYVNGLPLMSATNIYADSVVNVIAQSGGGTTMNATNEIVLLGDLNVNVIGGGSSSGVTTAVDAPNHISIGGGVHISKDHALNFTLIGVSSASSTVIQGDVSVSRTQSSGIIRAVDILGNSNVTVHGDVYHGELLSTGTSIAVNVNSTSTAPTSTLTIYGDIFSSYDTTLVSINSIGPQSTLRGSLTSSWDGALTIQPLIVTNGITIGSSSRTVRVTPSPYKPVINTQTVNINPDSLVEFVIYDEDGTPNIYTTIGALHPASVREGLVYGTKRVGTARIPDPLYVDVDSIVDGQSGKAVIKNSTLAKINGTQIAGISN